MKVNGLTESLSQNDRNAIDAFLLREYEDADYFHSKNMDEYIEYMFDAYVNMYRRDAVMIDINGVSKKERYTNRLGKSAELRFSWDRQFSADGVEKLNAFWNEWLNNQE